MHKFSWYEFSFFAVLCVLKMKIIEEFCKQWWPEVTDFLQIYNLNLALIYNYIL